MKTKKRIRYFAVFMILNLLFEIVSPTVALALTNGPMQPEFGGFEPANSSEMVDLFTGDFKYNIPLMDVDGYPLNLAYHAGQNMESEASWVGLGWSLNPGVLNRMMKGLPDDFNGDEVTNQTQMKPFVTAGYGWHQSKWVGTGFSVSLFVNLYGQSNVNGSGKTPYPMTVFNSYKGYGYEEEYDSHGSFNQTFPEESFKSDYSSVSSGVTHSSQDGSSQSNASTSGVGYIFDKFTKNVKISTRDRVLALKLNLILFRYENSLKKLRLVDRFLMRYHREWHILLKCNIVQSEAGLVVQLNSVFGVKGRSE
jgi:hypothetical protein